MVRLAVAAAIALFLPARAAAAPDSSLAAVITASCASSASPLDCATEPLMEIVDREGAANAIAVLDELIRHSPALARDAHGLAHRVGIRAYRSPETLTAVFASCPPTNLSGCYHGVMQGFFLDLRERGTPLTGELLDDACAGHSGAPGTLMFQCLHGLGHGVMAYHDNDLQRALRSCDMLTHPPHRTDCHAGAFMENLVLATHPHHASTGAINGAHAHGHAAEPLNHADHQYPCSAVDDVYRSACYTMQSSAMLHLNGGDVLATAADCRQAPKEYVATCLTSLGRDVYALAGGDRDTAAGICAKLQETDAAECVRGVASTMVNARSAPEDGLEFCRALTGTIAKRGCYEVVGTAMLALVPSPLTRMQLCRAAEPGHDTDCARAAGLPTPVEPAPQPRSGS